jgi:hypothetical protein
MNLSDEQVVETRIVLEIYDGEGRIQVEFEDLAQFKDVIQRSPRSMVDYFQNNLFDSPEMDDPEDALVRMASRAGDEGLVTVPPEDDDPKLFDAMTTIFQNAAELTGSSPQDGGDGGDFLQSLVRDQQHQDENGKGSG